MQSSAPNSRFFYGRHILAGSAIAFLFLFFSCEGARAPAPGPASAGAESPSPSPWSGASETLTPFPSWTIFSPPSISPSPYPSVSSSPDLNVPVPSPDDEHDSPPVIFPSPLATTNPAEIDTAPEINKPETSTNRKINGGAKAGIVFGVFFGACFAMGGIYIYVTRRKNIRKTSGAAL